VGRRERLDDGLVVHAETGRGRRGPDGRQRVPHVAPLPVRAGVEVLRHDGADADLVAVIRGPGRDPVELV
jgi:hypothetical protein